MIRHRHEASATGGDGGADHEVVGRTGNVETARRVILELEHAGVDSDSIELAAWESDESTPPWSLLRRMVAGSLAAALVFSLAGLSFALISGVAVAWGWLLLGALLGSIVGALIGAALTTGTSPAWLTSFSVRGRGAMEVRVRSSDEDQIEIATRTLDRSRDVWTTEASS